MKITWQGPWMNFSVWNCLLDLFERILLIDGHHEILVIRVSSLHFLLLREIKVTLGSTSHIYKAMNILIGCQGQIWLLVLTLLPWNHFLSSDLAAACLEHAVCPCPIPSLLTPRSLCLPACSRSNHLQGQWPTPLEVLGHFSNTALHFNYHSSAFKTLHSCIGHLSFKNAGGHNRSQFY